MTTLARRTLHIVAPATVVAAFVAAVTLTLTGTSGTTAAATPRVEPPTSVTASSLLPAPTFPELDVPDVPLPRAEPAPSATPVAYTCEPQADARTDDPARPNIITNKDCPDLIAAKERAQREYRDALADESETEVGDWRESACSDPSSSVYGTTACGADLDVLNDPSPATTTD